MRDDPVAGSAVGGRRRGVGRSADAAPVLPVAPVLLVLAALVVAIAAGCGTSGRQLRAPEGFVAPEAHHVASPQSEGPNGMLVTGADFDPGNELPLADVLAQWVPTLSWWNIPAGTTELVVLVSEFHRTDPTLIWAVAGLGPASAGLFNQPPLPQGVRTLARPDGSSAWPGYPPGGTRVVFTLCALATPLSPDATAGDAWNTCGDEPLGVATVSGFVPAIQNLGDQ